MQSELHERLEYLVNYSSQLIFVSGESIAQQQKTLEAFVFQQHDDTEIAYLTAQENMEPSDYRRQLCRQLLGQVVGSFVRPLNELLSDLNSHEGPILIAITQAHNLPDVLLQELWDLVLQSRFAGNNQHLNVLLFANNDWAERAKQWLPAKNTETPLIICSQSVMSEQQSFESELDKMIASRREAFQAHLENRQRENTQTFTNPLKSKWFYIAVICVFLITFSGLIYWQYGDKLASIFAPINPSSSEAGKTQVEPGSANNKLNGDGEPEESDAPAKQDSPSQQYAETGNVEIVADPSEVPSNAGQPTAGEALVSDASDGNPLITNWENAVSSLPEVNSSMENKGDSEPALATGEDDNKTAIGENAVSAGKETTQETQANPTNGDDNLVQSDEATLPSQDSWIGENDYAIQMLAMKNERVLSEFLRENNLSEHTRIYKTMRYGGEWFVVLSKQTYTSLSQAQKARTNLPDYPGKQNAFIKRGDQILSEIGKVQN